MRGRFLFLLSVRVIVRGELLIMVLGSIFLFGFILLVEQYEGYVYNPCQLRTCNDRGVCRLADIPRKYECVCDDGYTGPDCQDIVAIEASDGSDNAVCAPDTCNNHGKCQADDDDGLSCSCSHGYSGKHCQNSPCHSHSCGTHRHCIVTSHSPYHACQCDPGYTGSHCTHRVCASHTCSGHGTCQGSSVAPYYTCQCNAGRTGQDCQDNVCGSHTCSGHGTCHGSSVSPYYTCQCEEGYGGVDCSDVLATWSLWEPWDQCSKSCGTGGVQVRRRACNLGKDRLSPNVCGTSHDTYQIQPCFTGSCVNWSTWGVWSVCSETCGNGFSARTRDCMNGTSKVDASECGESRGGYEINTCNDRQCVDGAWSNWGDWSHCDVTCDMGSQIRTRACDSPAPLGGMNCTGSNVETRTCNMSECASCALLASPTNGAIMMTGLAKGNKAVYTCNHGYTLHGDSERTCQDNNEWSGQESTCLNVVWSDWQDWSDCSEICGQGITARQRTCMNGTLVTDISLCGASRDGYEIKPCFIQACADGAWSNWGTWNNCDVTCGSGQQSRTRACDSPAPLGGMNCTGDSTQSQPCTMSACASCAILDSPANGVINVTGLTKGSEAVYTCNQGNVMQGNSIRTCLDTHVWSGHEPSCLRVCGEVDSPLHGYITVSSYTVGSTASIHCDAGYFLHGSSLRYCLDTGYWSGETPNCFKHCESLPDIRNGQVFTTGHLGGSNAVYMCEHEYTLYGNATRTCLDDGTWTGNAPTCKTVIECPVLHNPANGVVDVSGTAVGSTASYTCSQWATREGPAARTCQADGSWSGTVPVCFMDT